MNAYIAKYEKESLIRLLVLQPLVESLISNYAKNEKTDTKFLAALRQSRTRLDNAIKLRRSFLDKEADDNLSKAVNKLNVLFLPTPEYSKKFKAMMELKENFPMAVDDFNDWYSFVIETTCRTYQFYSGAGVVQAFIKWLADDSNYYSSLGKQVDGLEATTDAFNEKWAEVAKANHDYFLDAQYQYAKLMYYDKAIEQLAKIGFSTNSEVIQNVIWSCAIQYSPYKVPALFNQAAQWIGVDDCTKVDDERLFIAAIYFMRATDTWNKGNRKMLYRMMLECHDVFDLLKNET